MTLVLGSINADFCNQTLTFQDLENWVFPCKHRCWLSRERVPVRVFCRAAPGWSTSWSSPSATSSLPRWARIARTHKTIKSFRNEKKRPENINGREEIRGKSKYGLCFFMLRDYIRAPLAQRRNIFQLAKRRRGSIVKGVHVRLGHAYKIHSGIDFGRFWWISMSHDSLSNTSYFFILSNVFRVPEKYPSSPNYPHPNLFRS